MVRCSVLHNKQIILRAPNKKTMQQAVVCMVDLGDSADNLKLVVQQPVSNRHVSSEKVQALSNKRTYTTAVFVKCF